MVSARQDNPLNTCGGDAMATIERRLRDLVSIGPAMLKDFDLLGIRSVAQTGAAEAREPLREAVQSDGQESGRLRP